MITGVGEKSCWTCHWTASMAMSETNSIEEGDLTESRILETAKKIKSCNVCRKALYCSRECQVRDWSNHKFNCEPRKQKPVVLDASPGESRAIPQERPVRNVLKCNFSESQKEKWEKRLKKECQAFAKIKVINFSQRHAESAFLRGGYRLPKTYWGNRVEKVIEECLELPKGLLDSLPDGMGEGKLALDLGCGLGEATFGLLKKKWEVIAVDFSKKVLEELEKKAIKDDAECVSSGRLKLVEATIGNDFSHEGYQFPNGVDLVLASDSLPYFNPEQIKAILATVYASLKSGGQFIGNFFSADGGDRTNIGLERCRKAWFVESKDHAIALLSEGGFEIESCTAGSLDRPLSATFKARKPFD